MVKLCAGFLRGCGLVLGLVSLAVRAAEPVAPTDDKLELYACSYGRSRFPETSAFRDGRKGEFVEIAWGFYVARSGAEVTLIDTGFNDPATAKKWWVKMTAEPAQLLADLKIDPAKVSRVIITHLHFDHVGNLPLFPKAQVVISRRDRDDYVNKKPLGGMIYDPRVAEILSDPARTHVIGGREMLSGGFEVEMVGGHTAGSSVVHLFHQGTHYVLAGDECYLCANQKEQRPIGQTADLKRNIAFLSRIADPAVIVLPCHDPEIFTKYPAVTPNIVRVFGPKEY